MWMWQMGTWSNWVGGVIHALPWITPVESQSCFPSLHPNSSTKKDRDEISGWKKRKARIWKTHPTSLSLSPYFYLHISGVYLSLERWYLVRIFAQNKNILTIAPLHLFEKKEKLNGIFSIFLLAFMVSVKTLVIFFCFDTLPTFYKAK